MAILGLACNFPLLVARQTPQAPPILLTPLAEWPTPTTWLDEPEVADTEIPGLLPTQAELPQLQEGQPLPGKIAYACYLEQQDDICLLTLASGQIERLTTHPATDFYPSISRDGGTILFSSNRDGNFEIFRMDTDGGNLVQLTENLGDLYAPELSPDGQWIVFARESGGHQHIWRMRSDGSEPHALTEGELDAIDPSYSPDGLWISFTSNRSGSNQLYRMEWDGGRWIEVISGIANMGGRNSWSADSQWISFYAGLRQDGSRNIYSVRLDGSELRQLTNGGDNLGPSYSPDGLWIAFTSYRSGNNDLWAVRADGREVIQLTSDPRSEWQPRWGP